MLIYNTMTRKKEEFVPIKQGKVGLYACGITTYDYCHIGHARSAIVFDVLVRFLRSQGLDVTFVRNFTDVDDKIINRAIAEGAPEKEISTRCKEISEKFIKAFHEDMDVLGVQRANVEPKATEHIDGMIQLCVDLIAKGAAYSTPSGDVYFRVRAYADYGKLSGRNIDDMRSGARVIPEEAKEDPLDFALWKGAKPGEPSWTSPWGQGRPGWHIECSAMTEKHLPLPLDIHGGGQDLIFPHHENEIAQTEAATGKEFARYWVHNGFVQIDAEKMSKSLGNFKTIRDILQNHLPEVLRFFLLTRHYRSPIDFTFEAMDDAEKNLKRIYETLALISKELKSPLPKAGKTDANLQKEYEEFATSWLSAMNDDVNTAAALGHINGILHLANRILDDKALRKTTEGREVLQNISSSMQKWGEVLGLFQIAPEQFLESLKQCRSKRNKVDMAKVEQLLEERLKARATKDYAASDKVRDALLELGVVVRDTPEGQVWDIA